MGNMKAERKNTVIERFKEGRWNVTMVVGKRERLPTKMKGCGKAI